MSRRTFVKARGAAIAAACAVGLSACMVGGDSGPTSVSFGPKHLQPLSPQTMALIEQKGMDKNSPILLRIFKEESELEIWKKNREGKYALLKAFPICRWSGELGPKVQTGDRQAPEGFYFITPELMNPRSSYYLSFNLGYPNEFDRAHGRTGAHLMVHGDCSSAGCYAMTDEQIKEIFALARESFDGGQLAFQVQAFPFRMTAKNLARHRKNPNLAFWRMLKEGSDHFELTKQEPKIDICEKRYIFNAHLLDPSQLFDAKGKCPEYEIPQEIAVAARSKRNADESEMALLANLLPPAPIRTGRDGGGNPAFAARVPGDDNLTTASTPNGEAGAASSAARASASTPVPQANPRRGGETKASAYASSNGSRARTQEAGDRGADEPEQSAQPAQQQAPAALPGAAPIRAAGGGFSFQQ
ncbi:MAG: murein L,D-transpeptidase [Bradyrhizobiaceae bacterium]|nr:murein L,D-transpeptidase [Bradyrhizobiaceae bacterium]